MCLKRFASSSQATSKLQDHGEGDGERGERRAPKTGNCNEDWPEGEADFGLLLRLRTHSKIAADSYPWLQNYLTQECHCKPSMRWQPRRPGTVPWSTAACMVIHLPSLLDCRCPNHVKRSHDCRSVVDCPRMRLYNETTPMRSRSCLRSQANSASVACASAEPSQ